MLNVTFLIDLYILHVRYRTPHHQNVPHEIHTISVANKDRSPGESLDSGYNIASTVAEFVKDRACQTEFVDVDNDLEFYDGKLTLFSGKL